MIVVKLFGGLGNQLFQYAAARRLAHLHGTDTLLDLRWYGTQALRAPDLLNLRVAARPASAQHLLPEPDPAWTGAGRRARAVRRLTARRHGWHARTERLPGVVDSALLRAPDRTQMVGYWQSERYFTDVAPTLRRELVPERPSGPQAAALARRLVETGAVSVHVRRGDFVGDPTSRLAHGVCGPAYYARALGLMDDLLGSPEYALFSDDPAWAGAHVRHPRLRVVSEQPSPWPAHDELLLMSRCRAHVTANSSFSWWGAWLGDETESREVIAPTAWFADPRLRADDIVPGRWHRV